MNFKKTFYIFPAALFLWAAPTYAATVGDCGGFQRVWAACTLDEDCMTGKDYCRNPLTYARNSAKAVSEYNSCMQRDHICTITDQAMPKELPICAAGQCVAAPPAFNVPGRPSFPTPVPK